MTDKIVLEGLALDPVLGGVGGRVLASLIQSVMIAVAEVLAPARPNGSGLNVSVGHTWCLVVTYGTFHEGVDSLPV